MTDRLPPGLYERLVSLGLESQLRQLDEGRFATQIAAPERAELPRLLARYVHDLLYLALEAQGGKDAGKKQLDICQGVLEGLAKDQTAVLPEDALREPAALLTAIAEVQALTAQTPEETTIPLGSGDLLVNARGEPGLGPTLVAEIPSADRIDLLCAFIKWNGFRVLEPAILRHLERGRRLRVITTTYIGATERRALDVLQKAGAEVKVSYETRTTRLHAKAWLFERDSGFSTAYVGSSNLSHSALLDGVEWNVRLSQAQTPVVLEKFRATFASYWEDGQFEDYDPERDAERFDDAVARARGISSPSPVPAFELRPYPFQVEILEKLQAERERHGRHRNLVVAATGTGKTLVAAFDYRRLAAEGPRPRLLFVALQPLRDAFARRRWSQREDRRSGVGVIEGGFDFEHDPEAASWALRKVSRELRATPGRLEGAAAAPRFSTRSEGRRGCAGCVPRGPQGSRGALTTLRDRSRAIAHREGAKATRHQQLPAPQSAADRLQGFVSARPGPASCRGHRPRSPRRGRRG